MKFKKKIFDFMSLNSENEKGELFVYGDIADTKWYEDDVTVRGVRDALSEMGNVKTLELHINSNGGSVAAGNTIVNLIDSYKQKTGCVVHTFIDGIAASMASGIAMAGDKIYMAQNAIFMVHKPFSVAWGNSDEMLHTAEILEKVEDTLVKNYMRHFSGTEDELRQLLADESWLTAEEALDYGFCDEIVEPVKIAASATGIRINDTEFSDIKVCSKFKIKEGVGQSVFDYDEKLSEIGIDEDSFKSFGVSSEIVSRIASKIEERREEDHEDFLTKEKATESLGADMDMETLLSYAKAGMEIDAAASEKAKAYDKLVSAAIEDAIKSGVRAKGENFNDTKWKKILNTLTYEEIVDQKNEWDAEAKLVLRAGKRVSQVKDPEIGANNSAVNLDDYKL